MSVSQKVLVLGLGASGRTAARFYASRGFEVLAADTRPQPPKLEELQQEIANLRFLGAQVTPETAAEVSEVMISPDFLPNTRFLRRLSKKLVSTVFPWSVR